VRSLSSKPGRVRAGDLERGGGPPPRSPAGAVHPFRNPGLPAVSMSDRSSRRSAGHCLPSVARAAGEGRVRPPGSPYRAAQLGLGIVGRTSYGSRPVGRGQHSDELFVVNSI
jgi:hypothetical protein